MSSTCVPTLCSIDSAFSSIPTTCCCGRRLHVHQQSFSPSIFNSVASICSRRSDTSNSHRKKERKATKRVSLDWEIVITLWSRSGFSQTYSYTCIQNDRIRTTMWRRRTTFGTYRHTHTHTHTHNYWILLALETSLLLLLIWATKLVESYCSKWSILSIQRERVLRSNCMRVKSSQVESYHHQHHQQQHHHHHHHFWLDIITGLVRLL